MGKLPHRLGNHILISHLIYVLSNPDSFPVARVCQRLSRERAYSHIARDCGRVSIYQTHPRPQAQARAALTVALVQAVEGPGSGC
jgi:hypothetical protein